jgi:hypothetical protein
LYETLRVRAVVLAGHELDRAGADRAVNAEVVSIDGIRCHVANHWQRSVAMILQHEYQSLDPLPCKGAEDVQAFYQQQVAPGCYRAALDLVKTELGSRLLPMVHTELTKLRTALQMIEAASGSLDPSTQDQLQRIELDWHKQLQMQDSDSGVLMHPRLRQFMALCPTAVSDLRATTALAVARQALATEFEVVSTRFHTAVTRLMALPSAHESVAPAVWALRDTLIRYETSWRRRCSQEEKEKPTEALLWSGVFPTLAVWEGSKLLEEIVNSYAKEAEVR